MLDWRRYCGGGHGCRYGGRCGVRCGRCYGRRQGAADDSGMIGGSIELETTRCPPVRPTSAPEAEADPLFRISAAYTSSMTISRIADSTKVTWL